MQANYYKINYFDIYSLDFAHCKKFFDTISDREDPISHEFLEALKSEQWKEPTGTRIKMINALKKMLENGPDEFIEDLIKVNEAPNNHIINLLKVTEGTNPYLIQTVVHQILGISDKNEQASADLRQEYFEILKTSGFLHCDYMNVNTGAIPHNPGVLAERFLNEHQDVKTLIIGCGEARKTYAPLCTPTLKTQHRPHDQPALQIDISANMGPDIVTDVHNPEFWSMIPNERFADISDHTNGHFVFEGENSGNTLLEMYRTLEPNGSYSTIHHILKEDKEKLEKAGFFVEGNRAIKGTRKENNNTCSIC